MEKKEEIQEQEVVVAKQAEKSPEQIEQEKQQQLMLQNIDFIKKLRVRLDGLNFIVSNVGDKSMEKIYASNHILLCKAWFGEVLESLGDNVSSQQQLHQATDIMEETDVSEPLKVQVHKKEDGKERTTVDANEIESMNHVRTDVLKIINEVPLLISVIDTIYETYLFQHLKETKFWMERELFRIKKAYKQKLFQNTEQGKRKLPKRPEKKRPLLSNQGQRPPIPQIKFEGDKGKVIDLKQVQEQPKAEPKADIQSVKEENKDEANS